MQEEHKDRELIKNQVLSVTHQLLVELDKERALRILTPQSSLQRELGIDSLARVELFHRIETALNVSLADSVLSQAETVNELIDAVMRSGPALKEMPKQKAFEMVQSRYSAAKANTLVEILYEMVEKEPQRPHVYLQGEGNQETIISYGKLFSQAQSIASSLQKLGIGAGDTVAIMLPTSEDFFYSFFGILLLGAIPVSIYPPFRPDRITEYAMRESTILRNAQVRILITFQQAERLSEILRAFVPSLEHVKTAKELQTEPGNVIAINFQSKSPALVQYTSGSTSTPKGVLLSHENILANIRSIGEATNISAADVGVSWLPLYHDMGLIGSWLNCFYHAIPIVIMSPLAFLTRPERWFWAIHYHRGTLSGAPNFAYELCVRRITASQIEGLDLSSWRLCFNGAEQISPKTLRKFSNTYAAYGFKKETMFPVYGLAESAVALVFPPPEREPKFDYIARLPFEKDNLAIKVEPNSPQSLEYVSCGSAIPHHEVRIVDKNNQPINERIVGSLQFKGPSVMMGYYRNPQATAASSHDGWLDSGDLAYQAEGEIYIVGRHKDLIIKAGRNLHPEEIEEATGQVLGVRKGCVIAFGVIDQKWQTEKLIIVAETRERNRALSRKMKSDIIDMVNQKLDIVPDEILLVAPHTIPKTSSGKLQRSACKALYTNKKIYSPQWPVFLQIVKLYIMALGVKVKRSFNFIGKLLYTTYAFLLFLISAILMMMTVFLLPQKFFATFLKGWARTLIWVSGCKFEISHQDESIKPQQAVYVANHASYIDAVALLAALPAGVRFVGKKELFKVPLLSTILKKIGVLAVDREEFSANIRDTKEIEEALKKGQGVAIFPEGGFSAIKGLLPFKLGAFKVAVETASPVCPIGIDGTRHIFRGNIPLLKPYKIKITIGKMIIPESKEWDEVTRLLTLSQKFIEKHCGEQSIEY
jgi:fatty-acyl-CoA synthase